MKIKLLPVYLLLFSVVSCSKHDQNTQSFIEVKPDKIESLKIQTPEMPDGFVLYQERLLKPGESSNEQVSQLWRRDSVKQDLVLIEETKKIIDNPQIASSFQIWNPDDKNGKKGKIEINIIICLTDSILENKINYYTKEAFASPFQCTEIPIVGDKSWIPEYPSQNSYSIMYLKFNVFVRVFVGLNNENADEIKKMTENLALKIENKIASESGT
jgi:hypothetical protein